MKNLRNLLNQDSDSFNERGEVDLNFGIIDECTMSVERLASAFRKLTINIMFKKEELFQDKLDIAFYSIIALNLICLTIAIVRL